MSIGNRRGARRATSGKMVDRMDWVGPGGVVLLHERGEFVFRGDAAVAHVDRITTLTALDRRVVFNDNKEGLFGMRVARQLEHPSKTPEVFTDASGKATPVPVLDNAGVTACTAAARARSATRCGARADAGRCSAEDWRQAGDACHPRSSEELRLSRPTGTRAATDCSRPIRSDTSVLTEGKQPAMNLTLSRRIDHLPLPVLILEGRVPRSHRARVHHVLGRPADERAVLTLRAPERQNFETPSLLLAPSSSDFPLLTSHF